MTRRSARTSARPAATASGLAVLGLAVGLLAAVEHRQRSSVGDVDVPWGMALALVSTWLGALGAEALARRGSTWFALGWALQLVLGSAGGGYLVADDATGWTYTLAGIAGMLAVVVATSLRRASATSRSGPSARAVPDDPT